MPNETLGASFSIDVTDLKAGLNQANRLIRESESEFKAAAAGMDDWTKSQKGLEERIKHLNNAADLQGKKVEALQAEYDRLIADGLDPTSAAAVELRTKINKEEEALAKTKKEIDKQTKALEEMESASDETETAADALRKTVEKQTAELDDLKEEYLNTVLTQGKFSKEAKELKKQIEKLSGELDDNNDKLSEAGDAAEEAADGFNVADGAAATFIGNGLTALVDAAKDAIGTVLELADSTREYRTIMASLESSSKLAGYSVADTEATFKQLNGVLGDTQGAATTTANLQAIGLEQDKLQELTNGVIGAWAKYGDSIPIDGLAEAVNHTAQLGEVQGTLADVIEWGGGTVEDFNATLAECSTEAERADAIQKLLAEQGLTEAGAAWQENNKSIVDANNAQAELDKTTAALGEKIEPITNKLTELKTSALQWLIDTGLPALKSGWGWVKDNLPAVGTIIGGITAAWLAFGGAQAILNGLQTAGIAIQTALNVAMNANPVGLIILAITALVATFMILWNECEGFRKFWINLWENIKKYAKVVADWFTQAWSDVSAWFVQAWSDVGTFFTDLWNGIVSGIQAAWAWVVGLVSTVATWIYDNVIAPIAKFFSDLWAGIVNAYHTVIDPWIEIVKRISVIIYETVIQPIVQFFVDLWASITSGLQTAWDWIVALASTVASWINDNVIQPVVGFFAALWQGLQDGAQAAWAFVSNVFSVVASWFNDNIIRPVTGFFSNLWNGFTEGASKAWNGIKSIFSSVASFFGDIFQKAWSKVKQVFSVGGKIFDGIKDGIVTAFKTVVNAIIRGINKVVKLPFEGLNTILDKLHGVEIVGVKPFDWLKWRAPIPQLPELATGGVVDKATAAVIGEDGAEAVMPLEKNTGWIKQLAKEIAAEQGGGIVVNQTNNYKQAYTSRIEQYKSRQQLFAAARLMKAGAR